MESPIGCSGEAAVCRARQHDTAKVRCHVRWDGYRRLRKHRRQARDRNRNAAATERDPDRLGTARKPA